MCARGMHPLISADLGILLLLYFGRRCQEFACLELIFIFYAPSVQKKLFIFFPCLRRSYRGSTPLTKFPSILKDVLIVTSSRPEDVTLEELPFLQHPGNPGIDLGFGRIHELSDAQLDDIQEIVCSFNPWSLIV